MVEKSKPFDEGNGEPIYFVTEKSAYHAEVIKNLRGDLITYMHDGFALIHNKEGKLSGHLYVNGKAYTYNSKKAKILPTLERLYANNPKPVEDAVQGFKDALAGNLRLDVARIADIKNFYTPTH